MRGWTCLLLLVTAATSWSCGADAPAGIDWNRMAGHLIERMNLQDGERVLLLGRPGEFDDLVPILREAIREAGAVDLGALSVTDQGYPGASENEFLNRAVAGDREALKALFMDVDLGIMLPGAAASHPAYAAMQDVLREGRGRTIHFHWSGAYDLNGNTLPITDSVSAAYQTALYETDYAALSALQSSFETAARGHEIRVTTSLGTDIRFRIGDRPVTQQDGDASADRASRARNLIDREIELPAGAVRVAPLEETVQGTIAFPTSTWNGQVVEGLVMEFTNGKVTRIDAAQGVEAVNAEVDDAGPAGRSFRELAVGFNPQLAIPQTDRWIPYYGYGAGVVRLSLGDNSELGGEVTGGYVRWNFFTDATVWVGDDVWVQDGRMVSN